MELAKIGLLLGKAEATYGVDPTPVATTNIIAAIKNEVTIDFGSELLMRDLLDGTFQKVYGPNVLPDVTLKFKTYLRGNRTDGVANDISAGGAGTAIDIDPLLQACDLIPSYTAESGGGLRDGAVRYLPGVYSTEGPSATFYLYSQRKLYKITGCKGDLNLNLAAGKFGILDWTFRGLFNPPVDSSVPGSQVWLATQPPLFERLNPPYYIGTTVTLTNATDVVNLASHGLFNGDRVRLSVSGGSLPTELTAGTWYYIVNRAASTFKLATTRGGSAINFTTDGTGTISIDSCPSVLYDTWAPSASASGPVLDTVTFNLGNQISRRVDAQSIYGVRGFHITARDTTGSLNPESVTEATHPLWADWKSGRTKPLSVGLGKDTGNRILIENKHVIEKINYSSDNDKRIQTVAFRATAAVGDVTGADFSIEFK